MSQAPSEAAPSFRTLLSLAWPVVISRASQVVVGLTDALMVAHLGEAALAATTAGAMNTYAVMILPMGTVFIVGSFSAQFFGKGDLVGARRYGYYGLLVALATQVFAVLGIVVTPTVLSWLPYASDVQTLMTDYMVIRLLSAGPAIAMEALGSYYGGLGDTRRAMRANIFAMGLNVVLCWVLINGNLGAPAMGVKGAAWANVLATTAACGLFLYWFFAERIGAHGLSAKEFRRMLRFGLPSGFNWFFEFFAFNGFINVVMAGLGTTSLAAMMSVLQINSMSFMPAFGLASAGAVLAGQAIGMKRHDDVGKVLRITLIATCVWQGAVGLLYLLVPKLLMRPFAADEATQGLLFEVGARMLMVSAAWQLFDATAMVIAETLRAAGDTAFTLWVRAGLAWLVMLPGGWVTARYLDWSDVGVLSWVIVYLALLAVALVFRFRAGSWRRIELTSEVPAH